MSLINDALAEQQCNDDIARLNLSQKGSMPINGFLLSRVYLRHSVTTTVDEYNGKMRPVTLAFLNALLQKLTNLDSELIRANREIQDYMLNKKLWDASLYHSECRFCSHYSDVILFCREEIKCELTNMGGVASMQNQQQPRTPGAHKLKLPELTLPTFDGTPEKYSKFMVQFEGIIDKFQISSFDKFSYLERQLTGSAKDLIDSISVTTMDYNTAKSLLDKAYLNNNIRQNGVIERILNMKLDPSQPYKWISDARVINEQVADYRITSETFLQYFFWSSLNDKFRQQLIHITGKSRPKLSEILDNFFDANTRVSDLESRDKKSGTATGAPSQTISFPTGVTSDSQEKKKSKDPKCVLCSAGDHRASQCSKFQTPSDKVKRLKALNRCERCMLGNHSTANCNCKFKLDCACGEKHFRFLCTSNSTKASKEKASSKQSTGQSTSTAAATADNSVSSNSSSAVVSLASGSVENGKILPSFTATIAKGGTKTEFVDCRGFCDTCNQDTLIESDFAKTMNLKVIESDIDLTIVGINDVNRIMSQRVEFAIKVGNQSYLIRALCVPSISINLKIPGICKLISAFQGKGFTEFADKQITCDRLLNAKILLGTDYCGIVLSGISKFGPENQIQSMYFESPSGVMLTGHITKLLADIHYLPQNKNSSI